MRTKNSCLSGPPVGRSVAWENAFFEMKLTWNYQDVSVLLPVVGSVPASAVTDREARRLLADLLVLTLILVYFGYRVLYALLLQPLRQLRHGEPRGAAHYVFLQSVIYEFVLFLRDR